MNTAEDRLLTLADIRALAGVCEVTVWRWTREHGLKTVKVGRWVRIRESDWQKFCERHTAGADGNSEGGVS